MPSHRFVLFDLDGTIVDSQQGVALSLTYALAQLGIPLTNLGDVHRFIGPPIAQTFSESYGLDATATRRAVDLYRRRYKEVGITGNRVYEGIPELLRDLHARGITLALATSKLAAFAHDILREHGLDRFFSHVGGADDHGQRENKADVIGAVLAEAGWTDPGEALMVGDHPSDILGARAHGLSAVAVTWGYGSPQSLRAAAPAWLVDSVPELRAILFP